MITRHPYLFSKENSVILLVDYQERFIDVLHENKETVKNIKLLLNGANIYAVPIVISEQVPEKLGKTIPELMSIASSAYYFSKSTMSCCGQNEFVNYLKQKNVSRIAVCGIEAHVCVLQTSLDLMNNGFQVHLVADAITTRIPHNKEIAIEKIKQAGGIITSVEGVLFEIAYEADNNDFKKLQQLFKEYSFVK